MTASDILVVGATGLLGGAICQRLCQAGRPVRAVHRPASEAQRTEALRRMGAKLVEADLKDRASLERACRGAGTVISTATTTMRDQSADSIPDVDEHGGLNLVAAARQAGVEHLIYLSFPEACDPAPPSPLSRAKRTVEAALRAGPVPYTLVWAAAFMETWLGQALGFAGTDAAARIPGDGTQPTGWVSREDVARVAVACLDRPELRNTAVTVVAENLSLNEVARLFGEAAGRPVSVQHLPVEALEAQLGAASTALEQSLAALLLRIAQGVPLAPDPRLADLTPPLTTVREYAFQVAGAGTPA
jgi:NADH dehydrogenase